MEHTTYLFIDGAYLRGAHDDAMKKVFAVLGDLALERIAETAGALKSYFYDCEDVCRPNESQVEFESRVAARQAQFSKIRALKGFHLQTGTMRSGKKREQKEVDVLLAVDMLTHGFQRNMTRAVLLSGDLDFRPVVEALVRGGVFVEVWYEKTSTSEQLPFAADFGYELTWHQLYNWNSEKFRKKYTPPVIQVGGGLPPTAVCIAKGQCDRCPVELCETYGGRGFSLIAYLGNEVQYFNHVDRAVVEGYFSVLYGPITWTWRS
jgi:uncharacterized LabA/DUF88 family protein